jgi:hypothetical protein
MTILTSIVGSRGGLWIEVPKAILSTPGVSYQDFVDAVCGRGSRTQGLSQALEVKLPRPRHISTDLIMSVVRLFSVS